MMINETTNQQLGERVAAASVIADTYVHARIDTPTKESATSTLRTMGLSVSDAIRLLMLHLANERCLPFGIEAPYGNGNGNAAKTLAEPPMEDSKKTVPLAGELMVELSENP